jgi:hypothetical protein
VAPEGPRFRLLDSFGAISNTSYTLSDYRRYNGATLSEEDEDAILGKIKRETLEAGGIFSFHGPSFRHRSWSFGMQVLGSADAQLPKELIRLLFDGNTPEESFRIDDAEGQGEIIGEIRLSHGREVELPRVGRWSLGASLKLLQGLFYSRVEEAEGEIRTELDGLEGGGSLRIHTATGGLGYGLDLGIWRSFPDEWSFSLAAKNLISSVRWTRGTEETIARFKVLESNLQDVAGEEDLVETEDKTYPIDAFSTSIAPELITGVAHQIDRWTFVADWTQGFEESSRTTRTPRLAIGAELSPREWVTGRAGVSLGGIDRRSLALGLGLSPGPVMIDLALAARDGYLPLTGRGIMLGLALGFRF